VEQRDIASAIEGILFAAGEPVSAERLCAVLEQDRETVDAATKALADACAYERRGVRVVTLGDSYQMCSAPEHAERIRQALETRKPPQLGQAALEALAIIAYFQPATRAIVEQIRGVDSSYTVNLLLERGLIEETGRLPVPGRPAQFCTTSLFLRCFGLTGLDQLPPLPESGEEGQPSLEEALAQLRQKREETED